MMKGNSKADILVVDDEPMIQNLLGSCLESCGHHVTVANNGLEALLALAEKDFGMVLMDVRMPVMDGLTATDFLRKCERGESHSLTEYPELVQSLCSRRKGTRIPVVAVTANIDDREMMLNAGMDDFIPKPFTLQRIFNIINQFCEKPKKDAVVDQRKHERYNVQDEGIFLSNGTMGQVVDISYSGLAIMYSNRDSIPHTWKAALSHPKEQRRIPGLQLQRIRTGKRYLSETSGVAMQTVGAIFNNIEIKQQRQIEEFVRGLI